MKLTTSERATINSFYSTKSMRNTTRLRAQQPKLFAKITAEIPSRKGHLPRSVLFELANPKLAGGCCETCGGSTPFENYVVWGYGRFCGLKCSAIGSVDTKRKVSQERYGVDNISQLASIKQKKTATCLANHGVLHPQQSAEVRAKSVASNLANHGVENGGQSRVGKKNRETTMLARFGSKNAMGNRDLVAKAARNGGKARSSLRDFDYNGTTMQVQGYEPKFLAYLRDVLQVPAEDVWVDNLPLIAYQVGSEKHTHLPDIWFTSASGTEWLVEVKSYYTLGLWSDNHRGVQVQKAKAEYALKAGYNYALVIFDHKLPGMLVYQNEAAATIKKRQLEKDFMQRFYSE